MFGVPAGKIQISYNTKLMLDVNGGFTTEERGTVEIKVTITTFQMFIPIHPSTFGSQGKGAMVSYWLHSMHWQTREQFLEEGKKRKHRYRQDFESSHLE